MESIDLQMEDLFDHVAADDGENEDMMGGASLHDTEEGNGNHDDPATQIEGEDGDVLAQLRDLSKGAAKKKVMKPQPKLDHVRITGERGIPILPKLFEKTQFKGKGHEGEDLKLMMSKLEHWAHRLFPKMTFDEVIERAERLGAKKSVQTCVKRMRLDMPILDEDFVTRREDEEEEGADRNDQHQDAVDADAEEVLDELLQEDEGSLFSQHPPPPVPHTGDDEDAWEAMMQEEALRSQSQPVVTSEQLATDKSPLDGHLTPVKQIESQPPASESITKEQKERMERNKQLAMEKRLARLGNSPAVNSQNKAQDTKQKTQPTSEDEDSVRKNSPVTKVTPLQESDTTENGGATDQQQTEDEILDSLAADEVTDAHTDNKGDDVTHIHRENKDEVTMVIHNHRENKDEVTEIQTDNSEPDNGQQHKTQSQDDDRMDTQEANTTDDRQQIKVQVIEPPENGDDTLEIQSQADNDTVQCHESVTHTTNTADIDMPEES